MSKSQTTRGLVQDLGTRVSCETARLTKEFTNCDERSLPSTTVWSFSKFWMEMDRHAFCVVKIIFIYFLLLCALAAFLPFSMVFDYFHPTESLQHTVEKANKLRTQNSLKYFSSLNSNSSIAHYNARLKENKQVKFAVGIITIKRTRDDGKDTNLGYVLQSAAAFDSMLKEKPLFNSSVGFICNVHSHPSEHTEAVQLYSYLPYFERYGSNSLGVSDLFLPHTDRPYKEVTDHKTKYEKETYDYVFCLQAAAKFNPEFILLIEEDAIPRAEFPEVLDHLISFRLWHQNYSNFGLVKFYYPAKWQGFGFSIIEMCDLISFCILGGSILCCIESCFSFRIFSSKLKLFLLGFLATLLSCYVLGRQNLNEIRRLSPSLYRMKGAEMCCTQAVLYPIQIVEELPHFMIAEALMVHTDLIIADFMNEMQLPNYMIEPNLFVHTGLHSSLPNMKKSPVEFLQ